MQDTRLSRREFLRVAALAAAGAAVGGCIPLDLLSTAIPTATPTPTPTATATPSPTATPVPSPTPEPTPADPVEILWFIGLGTGLRGEQLEAEERAINAFNASQGEIRLGHIIAMVPHDELRTMIAASSAPDVVGPVGMRGAVEFIDDWLDLDPLLAGYDLDDYNPAVFDAWRVRWWGLIGFPVTVYPSMIYYNRDLFDAAGLPYPPHGYGKPYADGGEWTIEKLEEIALQLTLDAGGSTPGGPGFDPGDMDQFGYHTQWTDARGMATLFGAGSFVADDGRTAQCPDHWREAFHWYHKGMWEGRFMPSGMYLGSELLGEGDPFDSGRMAMVHTHIWYSTCCIEDVKNWDIAAVPSYEGRVTAKLHSDMLGILNGSEHPKEALRVVDHLTARPELVEVWDGVPARTSLQGEYFAALDRRFPQGVDWQVAVDGLNYPDVPNHESWVPDPWRMYDRTKDFQFLLENTPDLDMDAAIDELVADLQVIFDEAEG